MVDLLGQVLEEARERRRIVDVKGRAAEGAELERGVLQAVRISAGKDDVGRLGPCSPCRCQPNAGAAADHDDGLPEQFRFAPGGRDSAGGGHGFLRNRCRSHGLALGGASRPYKALVDALAFRNGCPFTPTGGLAWFGPPRSGGRRDHGCSSGSRSHAVLVGSGIGRPGRSTLRTRPGCPQRGY
jgi:hypothetical protein